MRISGPTYMSSSTSSGQMDVVYRCSSLPHDTMPLNDCTPLPLLTLPRSRSRSLGLPFAERP